MTKPATERQPFRRLFDRFVMWRFFTIKTKENRPGWPIYLWPVVFVEYEPCTTDGRSIEKQSFGIGIRWLSWSWSWHGVNDDTSKAKAT